VRAPVPIARLHTSAFSTARIAPHPPVPVH
jgi:hypothetical protein